MLQVGESVSQSESSHVNAKPFSCAPSSCERRVSMLRFTNLISTSRRIRTIFLSSLPACRNSVTRSLCPKQRLSHESVPVSSSRLVIVHHQHAAAKQLRVTSDKMVSFSQHHLCHRSADIVPGQGSRVQAVKVNGHRQLPAEISGVLEHQGFGEAASISRYHQWHASQRYLSSLR